MIRSLGWDVRLTIELCKKKTLRLISANFLFTQDAMMTFTMITSLAGMGLAVASVPYGAGRHRGDVDPEVFSYGMKLNFVSQPIYLFAICFVKVAVGLSLLRIAFTKFWRNLIIGIMVVLVLYTIAAFFVSRVVTQQHLVLRP